MDKDTLAKKYLEITRAIDALELEKKQVADELMKTDFSKLVFEDKQVIKSTRRSVLIKAGKEEEVMIKFPACIVRTDNLIKDYLPTIKEKMPEAFETKTSIDTKVLEKNIEAIDYLELKELPYLQVRAAKDDNF